MLEWWHKPLPRDLDSCVTLLNENLDHLEEDSVRGNLLRRIYQRVNREANELSKKAQEGNPLAFATLSYEQILKCNAWVWGVTFCIDFDANRKGKTACTIFSALLYMLPNDPSWTIFRSYDDEWGRHCHLFQRPNMSAVLYLRKYLVVHPELAGDPTYQPYDLPSGNKEKFAILQQRLPRCFAPAYPLPTFREPQHFIWHGAPDTDYHKNIIMPEWRKWTPKNIMIRDSEYDRTFDFTVKHPEGQSDWRVVCKSYEAKDTKWSGSAVTGVILTEGVKKETLNEIKQRFRNDAFASWDYTPYEPRNVGSKTALAHRVFKGKEQLPLSPFVFSGFGIEKTPTFILPEEKKNDLLRVWANTAEGQARIKGLFYSSSPVVLTNLDLPFHTLSWTRQQLFEYCNNANLFRGLDPGYDHPTACAWGALNQQNVWFIYRVYSQASTSIDQRCKEIISLSENSRRQVHWGKGSDDYYYEEIHPNATSEVIISTVADYHVFKTDEVTKQPYANNYTKEGLVLVPSVTYRPRDRAQQFDKLLAPDLLRPHPQRKIPPGSKIYFLINEPGVALALEKLENIFWDRYRSGDQVGEPKDEIQEHDDDEFDAITYLVCSPYRWTPNRYHIRKESIEKDLSQQNRRRNQPQISAFATTG